MHEQEHEHEHERPISQQPLARLNSDEGCAKVAGNLLLSARARAPHEHSWQVPDGQCVVKLAIFYGFRAPKKGLDGGVL